MAEYKQKLLFRDEDNGSQTLESSMQSIWAYSNKSGNETSTGRFKVNISHETIYSMADDGFMDTPHVIDESVVGTVEKWTDNGWVLCFLCRKTSFVDFRVFEKELVDKFRCFVSATSFEVEKTIKPSKPPKNGKIFDKDYDVYKTSKKPKKMNKIFEIL